MTSVMTMYNYLCHYYSAIAQTLPLSTPFHRTIAGKSIIGGSEALPWEVQPKDGNYDGVNGHGRRRRPLGGTIRMEVASSRPDYLPTLSAAKTSKLSLLVKHHILAIDEAS